MIKKYLRRARDFINPHASRDWEDASLILAAKSLMSSDAWRAPPIFLDPFWLQEKEFKVYSQFGDDGIIQYLIAYLCLERKGRFIEFGVGDFFESNTHFLLINNRWKGYVMDGSEENILKVQTSPIYWRYQINAKTNYITRENVNNLLKESGFEKIQFLHIDLDGNDYWILSELDLSCYDPDILVLEYNALFGKERALSVPYDPGFYRMDAHYSGKYFGASLLALNNLAEEKGYYFIGCNSAGNNAYFLANRHLSRIPKTNVCDGYQKNGYREARDKDGALTYFDVDKEFDLVKGLPVIDVSSMVEVTL